MNIIPSLRTSVILVSFDELSLTHEDGVCMLCDWNRMAAKSTGWDDPNFIEWWDYKEYCRGGLK
jgi:hypothetical protein